MPQVVKPYTYSSGTTISSTQVNANEDAIINAVNALDEDNFDAGTQLPNSILAEIQPDIVDAHADTTTEYLTATSPGSTGGILALSDALPDKLTDEIERLRYRHLANNHLVSTKMMDSGGSPIDARWVEPQISGPQLFVNNGFETKTSAVAGDAPDNWTLVGTPTSLTITAPGLAVPSAGKYKKALRVTFRTTANEGFTQSFVGVKASTKYLIGMTYARVSGSPVLKITTTNGLASGYYQNLAATVTPSGTAIAHFQGIVQTSTTGTNLAVSFTNTNAAADVVDFYQVWAYELADSTNLGLAHIPMQTATISAASTGMTGYVTGGNTFRTDTLSSLTLAQYCPSPGYRFIYDVSVPVQAKTSTKENWVVYGKIQLDSGSGAADVAGPAVFSSDPISSNGQYGATINLKHIVENPTPNQTYTFSFVLGSYDSTTSPDTVYAPNVLSLVQTKATARLIVERL